MENIINTKVSKDQIYFLVLVDCIFFITFASILGYYLLTPFNNTIQWHYGWVGLFVVSLFTITLNAAYAYTQRTRCVACGKKISPVYTAHKCYTNRVDSKYVAKQVNAIISNLTKYFSDDKEKRALYSSISTCIMLRCMEDYKYCIISMGSILEYLVEKYCIINGLNPTPYNGKDGDGFVNYLQTAIENNIFGEKLRWQIAQTHLRNFRNYIHIKKEVKEDPVDKNWFTVIYPIYDGLIKAFMSDK